MRGAGSIAIIGAGFVGATTAYSLLISGAASEIILINRNRSIAHGHVEDLKDAAPFSHKTRIITGDFSDCGGADVVIVAVGVHQTPQTRSRLEDLEQSADIMRQVIAELMQHDPRGVILIASNPVDILAYAAWKWSGLPANRVIGSGTSLDTARFRRRLAERYGVAAENVHAYIIGEHGDSQVPVLSSAQIAGIHLEEFCQEYGLPYQVSALKAIGSETRTAGLEIQHAKGATYYGISTALTRIATAILGNEYAVLTVSSLAPESMRLGSVSLSLPSVINRQGVARILPISLNSDEADALHASAGLLKRHLASIELPAGMAA